MRRHVARYEVVSMPGVGHYPMIEDPPRFAARLGEALQKAGVALPLERFAPFRGPAGPAAHRWE
jgi:hypothetical protein